MFLELDKSIYYSEIYYLNYNFPIKLDIIDLFNFDETKKKKKINHIYKRFVNNSKI